MKPFRLQLERLGLWLLLAGFGGQLAWGGETEPIATRQTAFSIPFQIDPRTPADRAPVEVRLMVSADRGERWEQYESLKPDKRSFVFRAPRDGEYWFSIRAVDKQGRASPGGDPQPGLKVTVDTLAPRLDISAQRAASGELSAEWQIVDPLLDPNSLKIEYRVGEGAWEPLAAKIEPAAGRATMVGSGTWWPAKASGAITLRAQVSDKAGNPAVTQVVVSDGGIPRSEGPELAGPGGARTDPLPTARRGATMLPISSAAEAQTSVGRNPFEKFRESAPADEPVPPPRGNEPTANTTWPAQKGTSPFPARSPSDAQWRVSKTSSARGLGAVQAEGNPARRGLKPELDGRDAMSGMPLDLANLSPAERPKMVNSRTFEIDYEVESVGSAGVAKVELFGTRDGGETWISLGADPDNRSPLVVTVNGEGLYGFRVSVQSASGLGGQPPRGGDRPELWIGVDLTKPAATITAAEPGTNPDELNIYWDARDAALGNRPIALFFSGEPRGPWQPIAAGLENTGSYVWRLDARVKQQVYIKLEVRDAAGNQGTFETPQPVLLDRQLPQGRIRDVRPLGNEGDQARQPMRVENGFAR